MSEAVKNVATTAHIHKSEGLTFFWPARVGEVADFGKLVDSIAVQNWHSYVQNPHESNNQDASSYSQLHHDCICKPPAVTASDNGMMWGNSREARLFLAKAGPKECSQDLSNTQRDDRALTDDR